MTPGAFARFPMGCGPVDEIRHSRKLCSFRLCRIPIAVSASDDGEALWLRLAVAADAAALAAGRIDGELIVPVVSGEASFGHDMCIGSWPLEPGDLLVAHATVLDPAMHAVSAGDVVLDAR